MITIFKTGDFDYSDIGIDKPVRYTVEHLIEIAARTSKVNVTKEHTKEVIDEMSNFIVEDGLLRAEEPNNLDISGKGFSPVLNYDLVDMGDYYNPTNIVMTEIGFCDNPRTQIVYNSIKVPNGENMGEDSQLRDALDRNKQLNEEIGSLKSQISQLRKDNTAKDNKIKELTENSSNIDAKLKEYDSLKEIESKYNSMIDSRKDDLIFQLVGKDSKKAERFKNYSIEQLEDTIDLLKAKKTGKGITPQKTHVDQGDDPDNRENEEEDVYTDEQFEEDFKASGL